jgi:hypothetical protein
VTWKVSFSASRYVRNLDALAYTYLVCMCDNCGRKVEVYEDHLRVQNTSLPQPQNLIFNCNSESISSRHTNVTIAIEEARKKNPLAAE